MCFSLLYSDLFSCCYSCFFFFSIDFVFIIRVFYNSPRFTVILSRSYQDFPSDSPSTHTNAWQPPLSTFPSITGTTGEHTLMYHYPPKSIAYMTIYTWCLHPMGLEKFIMTCIHYYNIQKSFTPLNKLFALPIHHSFLPSSGNN